MLQIIIEGVALDLFAATAISLELNNPAVADEIADGSYSFPFNVPSTDHNRQVLGFGFLADSATMRNTWENAEIIIEGAWRIVGTLNLLYPMSETEYKFNINITSFLAKLKDININEYSLPISMGATLGEWCDAVHQFNVTPGADVVFPIVDTETHVRHGFDGQNFMSSGGRKANFINFYEFDYTNTNATAQAHRWYNPFQPWLRLNKLVEWIFNTKMNVNINIDALEGELATLIVTNDTVATVYDSDNNNTATNNEPANYPVIDINAFLPVQTALTFLQNLRTMFGINLYQTIDGYKLVANQTALQSNGADWSKYQDRSHRLEMPIPDRSLQFSHDWKDATYTDFIQKRLHILMRSEYQAPAGNWFRVHFQGEIIELPATNTANHKLWYNTTDNFFYTSITNSTYHKMVANVLGDVANVAALPILVTLQDTGKIYWVTDKQLYYVLLYLPSNTSCQWFPLCAKPDTAAGDTTKGELIQPSLRVIDDGDVYQARESTGPQVVQRFVVLKNDMPYKEYGARATDTLPTGFIAFWRGQQPTSENQNTQAVYAQASGRSWGYDGGLNATDKFSYSLLWSGEKGLYNTWHKQWQQIRQYSPLFVANFKLPIVEIINFNFYEKVRIGNQDYIVTKIKVTATMRGLGLCEVSAVRV